jgi:leucyl-tRNA synthetase
MSPITPHFCEHLWSEVLEKEGLVLDATWPKFHVDVSLSKKYNSLQAMLREFRLDFQKLMGGKKGKNAAAQELPTDAIIFCAEGYAPFQKAALIALGQVELDSENEPVDKKYMTQLKENSDIKNLSSADQIKALKFAAFHMSNEVKLRGKEALELEIPFNEAEMLNGQTGLIAKQLALSGHVTVQSAVENCEQDTMKPSKREQATPGKPAILFFRR